MPLNEAAKAAGYPTTFYKHTPAGVALDRMNVDEWLDRNVQGGRQVEDRDAAAPGLSERIRRRALRVQSALNLIYLFAGMRQGRLDLSGTGEDDKYTIEGGNDQLVAQNDRAVAPRIIDRSAMRSKRLHGNADGSYTCTFTAGGDGQDHAAPMSSCLRSRSPFCVSSIRRARVFGS